MNKQNLNQLSEKRNHLNGLYSDPKLFWNAPKEQVIELLQNYLMLHETLLSNGENDFQRIVLTAWVIAKEVGDRSFSPSEALHKIVALATCPPEDVQRPINRWTIKDLTEELYTQEIAAISQSSVWRLLNQAAIKPHKWIYWLNSPDPDFEEKMLRIVDLYLNPPRDGLLFCLDEKTGIQALQRKYPDHPTEPGRPYRREHSYERHGTQDLLAAFEVSSGDIFGELHDGHSSPYWEAFFQNLVCQYSKEQKFHFIQDNYSTHSTPGLCQTVADLCNIPLPKLPTQKDRRRWLSEDNKRIVFHYLPTHASWLNQIEIWFSTLTRKLLKRINVRSLQELKNKIVEFIEHYNNELAHPYKWTYTGKPLAV